MKLRWRILYILLGSLFLLPSCTDEDLDTTMYGGREDTEFYNNLEEINQALTACYFYMKDSWNDMSLELMFINDCASDDCEKGGSGLTDKRNIYQLETFNIFTTNSKVSQFWNMAYRAIYQINTLLDKSEIFRLENTDLTEDDKTLLTRYENEARWLRGVWYFNLAYLWGDVPLFLHAEQPADIYKPRTPVAQIWEQVIADFTAATALPKRSEYSEEDTGRVTSGAAYAMLGRTYWYNRDFENVYKLFQDKHIDGIIHLAAESHVDRSIKDPFSFAQTNVMGTLSLLQAAKLAWEGNFDGKLFYHVSTDEVYGSLQPDGGFFLETTKYDPHSPYSASKASSDHFVRAYHDTYGLPVKISNCSNNYGTYQFPEKLIPLFINNIRHNKPLPVYGTGENVRDWLFVEDHARAIDLIFHKGKVGDTYNIGGFNEWKNIDLIKVMIKVTDRLLGRPEGTSEKLITYVTDRAGHDLRYAIDSTKLHEELGWEPSLQFEEGIEKTVKWYLENQDWLDNVTSGEYMKYYESMYNL